MASPPPCSCALKCLILAHSDSAVAWGCLPAKQPQHLVLCRRVEGGTWIFSAALPSARCLSLGIARTSSALLSLTRHLRPSASKLAWRSLAREFEVKRTHPMNRFQHRSLQVLLFVPNPVSDLLLEQHRNPSSCFQARWHDFQSFFRLCRKNSCQKFGGFN